MGRFYDSNSNSIDDLDTAQYRPIQAGKKYFVYLPSSANSDFSNKTNDTIMYNGSPYTHRDTFTGVAGKTFLEDGSLIIKFLPSQYGAYEIDGITLGGDVGSAGVSNEWIMSMTASHYSPSSTSIYKPSVFNDIMGFQNNRCHHRSYEFERGSGEKYDMIRTELCRVMPGPRIEPRPRRKTVESREKTPSLNPPWAGSDQRPAYLLFAAASSQAIEPMSTAAMPSMMPQISIDTPNPSSSIVCTTAMMAIQNFLLFNSPNILEPPHPFGLWVALESDQGHCASLHYR